MKNLPPFAFLLLAGLAAPRVVADEDLPAPEAEGIVELRMAAALFDDFQFGGRVGAAGGGKYPLGAFLDIEGRPYGKAVRVRDSEILEYQFREYRFTLSPGLSVRLPVDRNGGWWTFAGGVGVSFGEYRGSARAAETTYPVWLEAGYRVKVGDRQYLGVAYQFFPLPDASPHRLAVQWGVR